MYSIYSPNQVIIITNYDIQYLIESLNIPENITTVIKTDDTEHYDYKTIENCSKQIYQEEILTTMFNVPDINCFKESHNLSVFPQACFSLCFLLNYIQKHNKSVIENLKHPVFDNNNNNVFIGTHSLKQLHILNNERKDKLGSILNFVNKCKTNMGRRLLKDKLLHPIKNQDILNNEYFAISLFLNHSNYIKDTNTSLNRIIDLEKFSRKITLSKMKPCEINTFHDSLNIIEFIIKKIKKNSELFKSLQHYYNHYNINITTVQKYIQEIKKFIKNNINLKVAAEIEVIKDVNFFVNNENVETHIKNGETNKQHIENMRHIFDNCFPKQKSNKKKGKYIVDYNVTEKTPATFQTTKTRSAVLQEKYEKNKLKYNVSNNYSLNMDVFKHLDFVPVSKTKNAKIKIESPEINKIHSDIFEWSVNFKPILTNAFNDFLNNLSKFNDKITYLSNFISIYDFTYSRFLCAEQYNLCKPVIVDDQDKSYFIAKQIKHPLIYHLNKNISYVSNDISLGRDNDKDGILLFGINAVGKSSLIRSIGINVLLAQAGMFVCCGEFQYKPYHSIFTRIIGNDDIFKNLSTFMVEMCEFNTIMKFSNKNSLILGDELCSGTTTKDAISIFTSGLIKLNEKRSSHIFATHFHEIKDSNYINNLTTLKKYYMSVFYDKERDELIYDRILKEGTGLDQYGIEVCKFIGYDNDFIELALQIRNEDTILDQKTSNYNSSKLKKGICEMCNINEAEEVHHLYPQKHANKKGFLPNGNHKNDKSNLLNICKDCHKKETKNDTIKKGLKLLEEQELLK